MLERKEENRERRKDVGKVKRSLQVGGLVLFLLIVALFGTTAVSADGVEGQLSFTYTPTCSGATVVIENTGPYTLAFDYQAVVSEIGEYNGGTPAVLSVQSSDGYPNHGETIGPYETLSFAEGWGPNYQGDWRTGPTNYGWAHLYIRYGLEGGPYYEDTKELYRLVDCDGVPSIRILDSVSSTSGEIVTRTLEIVGNNINRVEWNLTPEKASEDPLVWGNANYAFRLLTVQWRNDQWEHKFGFPGETINYPYDPDYVPEDPEYLTGAWYIPENTVSKSSSWWWLYPNRGITDYEHQGRLVITVVEKATWKTVHNLPEPWYLDDYVKIYWDSGQSYTPWRPLWGSRHNFYY